MAFSCVSELGIYMHRYSIVETIQNLLVQSNSQSLLQWREQVKKQVSELEELFYENGKFTPKATDVFMRHNWPGNVRELENLVERAVIMARGDMITQDDFPAIMREKNKSGTESNSVTSSGRTLKEAEKEIILHTLEETGGNRTHTAKILGISRRTLQLKLKEYGIN